jgi:hypothetical protein
VCRSLVRSNDHGKFNLCDTPLNERSMYSRVKKCRKRELLLTIIEKKMQETGIQLETSSTQTANKLLTLKPIRTIQTCAT